VLASSSGTCLHHHPDDGGSTYLWNVGRHSVKNTAVHPGRFWASYSPPWELEISLLYMYRRLACGEQCLEDELQNHCRIITFEGDIYD
jgi:hypothetical protein